MTEYEYLDDIETMRPSLVEAAIHNSMSPADAEDAVQDAIWYCLKNLHKYDPSKASLKTWVTNIVINRALDNNYDHARQACLVREPLGFDESKEVEKIKNRAKKPVHDWPRRAQAKQKAPQEPGYDPKYDVQISVRQALASLPEPLQSTAIAVLLEGYTEEEYAAMTTRTTRTVRRYVKEAKEQLRDLLKVWRE